MYKSVYPDLDLPQTNVLSYLFPPDQTPSPAPLWHDASDPQRKNLSPAQALQWIRRLGLGLERLGLARGDVVLIFTPNHIFVPVAYLGIVGAGLIFSGINPGYTHAEVVHQMANTRAQAVLVHPSLAATARAAAAEAGLAADRLFLFSDEPVEADGHLVDWRVGLLASEVAAAAYRWPALTPAEATQTVATINYSSGTTGLPKGVCVSHANLIANVEQTVFMRYAHKPFRFADRPPERWISFLPLYHAYGQLYTMLMAVRLRVPIYVMAAFRYEAFLGHVARFRITSLQVAPPILVMLAKRPETQRYDLRSVRDVLCGAAPLSRALQNACQRRFGFQINQGWGMTEVTCGATHVPGGLRDDSGSVGRLDPNCAARLVGDDGRDVAPGQPGELWIRGPNVCLGYWRNPAATRELLGPDGPDGPGGGPGGGDGWLRSGDVAVCDPDTGFFWIVDRKKELIKVNALQVAPAELEGVLLQHEHVADAAVVGLPDVDDGDGEERPRAYVVLHPSAHGQASPADIQAWLAQRVAKHKRLTGGVVFVDEVPKLASGKIQRKVVRAWAQRDADALRRQRAATPQAKL